VWGRGVQPGLSQVVAATVDVHVTLLTQAGVALPEDRTIDGLDMTDVFAGNSQEGHECYPFYFSADSTDPDTNLVAVRCGAFKAYWKTFGADPPQNISGGVQDTPLMFNLISDPGENTPIDSNSKAYAKAMKQMQQFRKDHLATITVVPNQLEGTAPEYAICHDGHPTATPINCSLTPENWAPAGVCSSEACIKRFGSLKTQCSASPSPSPAPSPSPSPTPSPSDLCPGPHCPAVPESNLKGCYVDHASKSCDLPFVVTGHCPGSKEPQVSDMSREICNAGCSLAGFKYFGVQNGGSGCFCGDSFGSMGEDTSEGACDMPCRGNASETCGGPNRNLVFEVQNADSVLVV